MGSAGLYWCLPGCQPGHTSSFVSQMTRTSLVCHHWSSVCLLTTLPRAQCGSTVSGNMVGEPRGADQGLTGRQTGGPLCPPPSAYSSSGAPGKWGEQ